MSTSLFVVEDQDCREERLGERVDFVVDIVDAALVRSICAGWHWRQAFATWLIMFNGEAPTRCCVGQLRMGSSFASTDLSSLENFSYISRLGIRAMDMFMESLRHQRACFCLVSSHRHHPHRCVMLLVSTQERITSAGPARVPKLDS